MIKMRILLWIVLLAVVGPMNSLQAGKTEKKEEIKYWQKTVKKHRNELNKLKGIKKTSKAQKARMLGLKEAINFIPDFIFLIDDKVTFSDTVSVRIVPVNTPDIQARTRRTVSNSRTPFRSTKLLK